MFDFSHLKKQEAKKDSAVEFVIQGVEGDSILYVKPALPEYNPAFRKAVLSIAEKNRKLRKKNDDEELDYDIYSKTIVVGWNGVVDASGKEVPFSEDVCKEYLKAIPAWLFTDLKAFSRDVENWMDDIDTEEAAKNSESA
jgi:hypothetical protein